MPAGRGIREAIQYLDARGAPYVPKNQKIFRPFPRFLPLAAGVSQEKPQYRYLITFPPK